MAIEITSTTMTADEMNKTFGIVPEAPAPNETPAAPAQPEQVSVEPGADSAPPQAPASEQPPAATPPADESTTIEDEGPAGQPGQERKVSRSQQRVNDALRAKYLAEGALETERRQREDLQRRLESLQQQPPAPAPGTPPAEAAPPDEAPTHDQMTPQQRFVAGMDPSDPMPKEEAFADWTEHQQAVAAWSGRNGARSIFRQTAQQQQAVEAQRQHQTRIEAAKQVHPDYDQRLTEAASLPLDPKGIMAGMLQASEIGPELAYHFATHPEDCVAIRGRQDWEIVRDMHRLEGRLLAQQPAGGHQAPPVAPPSPRIPSAPPPPPSVRGAHSASSPTVRTARTYEEFKEAERRDAEARRQR